MRQVQHRSLIMEPHLVQQAVELRQRHTSTIASTSVSVIARVRGERVVADLGGSFGGRLTGRSHRGTHHYREEATRVRRVVADELIGLVERDDFGHREPFSY